MVCACVDIGTNTTRVLVADVKDGRLTEVRQQRAFTRLGMAPEIAAEKIAEVAGVVAEQVAFAHASGARGVRVVATAAIRAAVNRDEFVNGMPVEVEILDEDQEARMAFLGATQTLADELPGTVAVVDVGGGSTEIAVGTVAGGVDWSSSFLVGSGALAARYLQTDPPTLPELRAARDHAMDVLATRAFPAADRAVAVGGSAASLRTRRRRGARPALAQARARDPLRRPMRRRRDPLLARRRARPAAPGGHPDPRCRRPAPAATVADRQRRPARGGRDRHGPPENVKALRPTSRRGR